jgi:hypothetical protein
MDKFSIADANEKKTNCSMSLPQLADLDSGDHTQNHLPKAFPGVYRTAPDGRFSQKV